MTVVAINTVELRQQAQAYHAAGLVLVPIPPGTKGPHTKGWNLPQNCLYPGKEVPPGYGLGLAHAFSGTMALDIDDMERATQWLAEHHVDLAQLLADPLSLQISSGRPGRAKLIYRMRQDASVLPSKMLNAHGLELRCGTSCGTKTVQDVLPPTIHPDTHEKYILKGDLNHIPAIPLPLLAAWQSLIDSDRQRRPIGDVPDSSLEELEQALEYLDPDMPYHEWIEILMSLHSAGDEYLELADRWSAGGSKYSGSHDVEQHWGSFSDSGGITVRTLYYRANRAGRSNTASAADVFQSVTSPGHPWHTLKVGARWDEPAPEARFQVHGLLPQGEVSVIAGPPGSGKSMLAIKIGISVAAGVPLLGNPDWTVGGGAVLVIDAEDSDEEFHRRVRAIRTNNPFLDQYRTQIMENLAFMNPRGRDIRMVDEQGEETPMVQEIIDFIQSAPTQISTLIMGPTINLMAGDESDNANGRSVMRAFERISAETGVCVPVIAHVNKDSGKSAARDMWSIRGASAFVGSARAVVHIQNMSAEEANRAKIADGERSQWLGLTVPKINGSRVILDPIWMKRCPHSADYGWHAEQLGILPDVVQEPDTDPIQSLVDRLIPILSLYRGTGVDRVGGVALANSHHMELGYSRAKCRQYIPLAVRQGLIDGEMTARGNRLDCMVFITQEGADDGPTPYFLD